MNTITVMLRYVCTYTLHSSTLESTYLCCSGLAYIYVYVRK